MDEARADTPRSLDPLVPVAHLVAEYFSLEELDNLAFEVGVRSEDVPGVTLRARARGLVEYADRHGLLADLLRTCEVKRPFVAWPGG